MKLKHYQPPEAQDEEKPLWIKVEEEDDAITISAVDESDAHIAYLLQLQRYLALPKSLGFTLDERGAIVCT